MSYISEFEIISKDWNLEERDAPGKLLSWILTQTTDKIIASEITGRFDIGNLFEYKFTLNYFNNKLISKLQLMPNHINEQCYARIGLLGNPSDGFNGKTLSLLIKNYYCEVIIQSNNEINNKSIKFQSNSKHDPSEFNNFESFQYHITTKGYYGGIRLLQATCKVFFQLCFNIGIYIQLQRGFTITYDTNIPRMVSTYFYAYNSLNDA